MPVTAPTLNMNGTSKKVLRDEVRAATHAIFEAEAVLQYMTVHSRDYQTTNDPDTYFRQARMEHRERLAALTRVREDLNAYGEAIAAQGRTISE